MRILATALAVMALTVLPVQADTSTPSAAPEQTKSEAGAVQLGENQAASTPSAVPTATDAEKPTEQTATETEATAGPKPDQSAQANSTDHGASAAEN